MHLAITSATHKGDSNGFRCENFRSGSLLASQEIAVNQSLSVASTVT